MYEKIAKYQVKKLNNYDLMNKFTPLDNEAVFTKNTFNNLIKENDIFLITYKQELMGIFTLKEDSFELSNINLDCIKIDYIYICEEYRYYGLATEIINDIIWVMKNFRLGFEYLLADSLVDSCMFFLNNGFDYYNSKKSKGGKNIITLYKKICD